MEGDGLEDGYATQRMSVSDDASVETRPTGRDGQCKKIPPSIMESHTSLCEQMSGKIITRASEAVVHRCRLQASDSTSVTLILQVTDGGLT